MCHVYESWFAQRISSRKFLKFMSARFARLYPLHLFTFLIVLIVGVALRNSVDMSQVPGVFDMITDYTAIPFVLTLTHAWGSHLEATWNTVSWSISVEWFLYLLFPIIILIQHKIKHHGIWLWAITGLTLLFIVAYIFEPNHIATIYAERGLPPQALAGHSKNSIDVITGSALLRGLGGFLIGVSAYQLYRNRIGMRWLKSGWIFVGVWLFLFLFWSMNQLLDPFAVLLFGVLILNSAYMEGSVKKVLNSQVFTFLGDISYSIYLCHMMIFLCYNWICMMKGTKSFPLEDTLLNNWIEVSIFLLVTIITATLTYNLVEKPARKWMNNKFR